MKQFLIVMFLLGCQKAYASGFVYKKVVGSDQPSLGELYLFRSSFESMGFQPVDSQNRGNMPYLGVDQIFVDYRWNKAVFLKIGWAVSSKKYENKILKINKGFAYHGRLTSNMPFVLYFHNTSHKEVKKVIQQLSSDVLPEKMAIKDMFNYLFPRANAEEPCPDKGFQAFNSSVAPVHEEIQGNQILGAISTCAIEAFREMKEKGGALINGTKTFFSRLYSAPSELWAETLSRFESFGKAIETIHKSLISFVKNITGVPLAIIKGMVCSVVGALGPHIIKGVTPVGLAALAATTAVTVKNLNKFSDLFKQMSRASKNKGHDMTLISGRVGACAVP